MVWGRNNPEARFGVSNISRVESFCQAVNQRDRGLKLSQKIKGVLLYQISC